MSGYTDKIKADVVRTPLARAFGCILTAYGCKKFQDMNNSRDAIGAPKRGYNAEDIIPQYADPKFLSKNWKTTLCTLNGQPVKNDDGTPKFFGVAPKYTIVDAEGVGKDVPVKKFLEPNDTGKNALVAIFLAYLNEFASHAATGAGEATKFEDHINRVRNAAEDLECGGIVATIMSITNRAVRENAITLDACLSTWVAPLKTAIQTYIAKILPSTNFAESILNKFLEFLMELAHVLGNTQYDALLAPVTHKVIIGGMRNINYSQACGQCEVFEESFFVAVENYVAEIAKAKAAKPKSPAAAAAPADAASDDTSDAAPAPAPKAKKSAKKAAAPAPAPATEDEDDAGEEAEAPAPVPTPAKKKSAKKAAAAATASATPAAPAKPKKTPKAAAAPTTPAPAAQIADWEADIGEDPAEEDDLDAYDE